MADNTTLNTGTSGDVIRDIDRAGIKTQVAQMDIGGAASEVLLTAGQKVMSASLPITVASDQTAIPVAVADIVASGTLFAAANTTAISTAGGMSAASAQITGAWVGTIQFEGTVDNTNWLPINGVFAGGTAPSPTITANGIVRFTPGGLAAIRLNATAWTSGTAVISLRAGRGMGGTFLNQSLPIGGNILGKVGIDQTTPGTTNLVSIGANGTVALNAALPVGANIIGKLGIDQTTPGTTNAVSVTNTSIPVTGTFFQTTQPVSLATNSPILAAGTAIVGKFGIDQTTPGTTNAVSVTNASLPVTGTFFQTTQPVSIATMPSTPVTGTFFQTTQPVSGIVTSSLATLLKGTTAAGSPTSEATDANTQSLHTKIVNASIPVTGTFFQTTQPVSGTFFQTTQPVSIATMPSTPVTGTFFQTTQPVSLAANTPVIAAGTAIIGKVGIDQTTPGTTNLVSIGTTGTVAINTALPTGANTIGAVNIAAAQTLATVTTVSAVTAITNALPAGTNKVGTVDIATAPATAKGTQGANAIPTQDLKDAGRNPIHFYTLVPVLSTATDTLQTLTGTKGGVNLGAPTTTPPVVTTGKTFRITRVSAAYISTATSGFAMVRIRFNTAGVVAITSPLAVSLAVGNSNPATANAMDTVEAALDEGWEFAAGTGIGISVQGFAAATATAVGYVLVSVTGYEY